MKTSIGLVAVASLFTSQVMATTLPDATYSGSMSIEADGGVYSPVTGIQEVYNQQTLQVNGAGTVSGSQTAPLLTAGSTCCGGANTSNASSVNGSMTVTNGPAPGISATATVTSIPNNGTGGSAVTSSSPAPTLSYSLEVIGPAGPTTLGVLAKGGVSPGALPPGGFTEVLSASFGVSNGIQDVAGFGAGPEQLSFLDNNTYSILADTVYTVSLSVYLALDVSGADGGGTLTGSAYVDPQFFVAPGYTIDLSPGIGNAAAAPIPAALPLFATGLSAMGLFGWRRKRKAAAIAT